MKCPEFSIRSCRLLIPTIMIALCINVAFAATAHEQVLYRFHGESDGSNPSGNLIADAEGNLYGTTEYRGQGNFYGTVFELVRPSKASDPWTEYTLYSFKDEGDGARPTAGLVFDNKGNLYGTTSDSNAGGYGTVFELQRPSAPAAPWMEIVLYSFQDNGDGADPFGGLVSDDAGNLYGTTESSVFELSPPSGSGTWTFTLLHSFSCCTSDGWNAVAGLVRDSKGNLYGTTEWGGYLKSPDCGSLGCGTVFEVSPPAAPGGNWTEQVLHAFTSGNDGFDLFAGLVLDQGGNLYGATYSGGTLGGGTAFQLMPPAAPGLLWTNNVIHNFSYSLTDGAVPSGMIFDKVGNLYGTARFGGNPCYFNSTSYGCGVVFELTPTQSGTWNETVLYFFTQDLLSSKEPGAGLLLDDHGNLYGTTIYGGYNHCVDDGSPGCGTVFRIGTAQ